MTSPWIAAARPKTLPAAVVPVAVGTACAHAAGGVAWGPALAALAGSLAIQIGTNFANDVFDAERGADGPDRLGPARAVATGAISASAMKRATAAAFAVAAAFGIYLVATAGWPVAAIGVLSIAAGLAYTGGPWPLGYHGLGDVAVLAFFGFVAVCGTAYVQLGFVPCVATLAAVPVGALATAILVVNNVRDRAGDARAGKRTLAVRFGRRGAIVEYVALVAVAYAVPIALAVSRGSVWCALPLATAPLAIRRVIALARAEIAQELRNAIGGQGGAEHNACLAATAQLLLVHGALLAIGLVA